jgi:hypothetical protein
MALELANHLPTIITATVGAIGMVGAHRTASRAARKNAKEAAEIEAYTRARAMDIQTIDRQNEEIKDLLKDNIELRRKNREYSVENDRLRTERAAFVKQIARLQEELRTKKND